jgi:tetratricopeptide (TPR) repeat protein
LRWTRRTTTALLFGLAVTPCDALAQQNKPAAEIRCDPDDPDSEKRPECQPPRILGIGGGGAGGNRVTFNWNGPGRIDFGIYDHGCLDYGMEFEHLLSANRSLVASVTPRDLTWEAALTAARAVLGDPAAKAAYESVLELAKHPAYGSYQPATAASVIAGEPDAVLTTLLAAVERKPDDANALFSFASALAQRGLANEAAAALARLRTLTPGVSMPLGVDAPAALDHLTGYTDMLRGRLGEARSKFSAAIAREPFLYESAHSLALLQAHEGNGAAAKRTYLAGMWRFKPKYLVACGGRGEEKARPPVDDMFDTSKGIEGKLPEFWHPDKASDLKPFYEQMGVLARASIAEAAPLQQRTIALSNNARFAGGSEDPYDAFAEKMSELISSLDETEPYVLQVKDDLDAAVAKAEEIAAQNQASVLERVTELAGRPGNHCPTYRSLISQGVRGVLPHAERVEAAYREYARVWYKMATGLNWHLGDPVWFEYNDVSLRAELVAMRSGMLAQMMTYYGFPADLVQECPEEFVPYGPPVPVPTEQGLRCENVLGGQTIKMDFEPPAGAPGPKFNVEAGCDKIKIDGNWDAVNAKAPGFGLKMGGRFSGTFERHKGFSMFGGVGADVQALGQSGSFKAGGYVEGDAAGLTGLGGRVIRTPPNNQAPEQMDFPLIAKPATAERGPRLKPYWQAP